MRSITMTLFLVAHCALLGCKQNEEMPATEPEPVAAVTTHGTEQLSVVAPEEPNPCSDNGWENPYASAKAGDWAKFATTFNIGFGTSEGVTYQVVTKNDGRTVEISLRSKMDPETEFQKCEIDVRQPLSFENRTGYFKPKPQLRFSVAGSGSETLDTCNQSLKTKWTSFDIRSRSGSSITKVWRADGIAVGGVVKKVSVSGTQSSISSELLVDYGNADGSLIPSAAETRPQSVASVQLVNSLGMKFVRQKAEAFTMGVHPKPMFFSKVIQFRSLGERLDYISLCPPQTSVMIDRDFFIGAHEVTIDQFRRFIEATGHTTDAERSGRGGTGLLPDGEFGNDSRFTWQNYGFRVSGDYPVANVSYNDAMAFCKWLSSKEGREYRLPTESEWEFACRAGTRTTFSSGDEPADLKGYANVSDQSLKRLFSEMKWAVSHDDGYAFMAPVGSFKPNAAGLYDMHGNVLEWTATKFWFFEPLKQSGLPPARELQYTTRGGNWFNEPVRAGSACRIGMRPDFRNSLTGFRIAIDASEADEDRATGDLSLSRSMPARRTQNR